MKRPEQDKFLIVGLAGLEAEIKLYLENVYRFEFYQGQFPRVNITGKLVKLSNNVKTLVTVDVIYKPEIVVSNKVSANVHRMR